MAGQKTMKALSINQKLKMNVMDNTERFLLKIREEFAKFERTMEELYFLKRVAQDLKNYREMLKIKKYD